jgi:hypothetical protein
MVVFSLIKFSRGCADTKLRLKLPFLDESFMNVVARMRCDVKIRVFVAISHRKPFFKLEIDEAKLS